MRKSKEQRLEDVRNAIAQWEAAGMGSSRKVEFMRSSLLTLTAGKALSAKQRDWLDALCAEGPPAPKGDPDQLARLDAACTHLESGDAGILKEFRDKLVMGWTMSEKQTAFMERLIAKGEKVAREGKWQPSPSMQAEGTFAAQVISGRSYTWKVNHQGVVQAAERVLAGQADEWSYDRVIDSVGPAVREYRDPKFKEGELVCVSPLYRDQETAIALVTGLPIALEGRVAYPVLMGAQPHVIHNERLSRNKAKT